MMLIIGFIVFVMNKTVLKFSCGHCFHSELRIIEEGMWDVLRFALMHALHHIIYTMHHIIAKWYLTYVHPIIITPILGRRGKSEAPTIL